jgi:hypothetical protein
MLASGSFDLTVRLWNIGLPMEEWQQMERSWDETTRQERQEREERARRLREERERLDREERERKEREEQQRMVWRATGKCEVCGKPLTFVQRMFAKTRCKEHKRTKVGL